MLKTPLKIVLLISLLLSGFAATASTPACRGDDCINEQQLYLSWALGYGQRSNPLYGGEKLDLVILPEIYYYSKYWFFDNGRLGSSFALTENTQLSIIGQLNQEKGYFQQWFSGNLLQFEANTFSDMPQFSTVADRQAPYPVAVSQVSKRPTALDVGLQIDTVSYGTLWQLAYWTDVSGQHHGQHASLGARRGWQSPYGKWQLSAHIHWKSAQLIDTYYGLTALEVPPGQEYQGRDSWQAELRLNWNKPLTERWSVLVFLRYLQLDSAMTDSALVRSDHVTTWFGGVSYRFF
ncbi:Outer membrane scaffolding protein for murein synthesis, MipA/OmpV family [Arsukibacterium tuosuense]|uniref:Outer membrane scaffolding protein for murein synthesis, MipA/OmpV family n=1 Tax=Arsukibacterium tuosuense TaxID=1323745 RepID=A0A285INJ0_9GAMM|nr:MipA/OmpV family protein [Arsukibacterium tuosuense]SNY49575.1 Outer membrane scaffolding protein for murein synthesis, MipA/OmpV family [Arsukibacterium tuosuense]